jgi:hypothetical protein
MRLIRSLLLLFATSVSAFAADDRFDNVDEALSFSAFDASFRGKFSGILDLEAYRVEQPAPALIITNGHALFNPRLSLFFDARWGTDIYTFVQVRADRGFDPNSETRRFRWDEYAVRFKLGPEGSLVLQLGKFATILGNWVGRHASWDNPFVGAPLPYENVTAISDRAAPASAARFVAPDAGEKYDYNPVVWGPSYATGFSLSGTRGLWDYAVEVKNSGPASRPEAWALDNVGFEVPAFTGRMGFRPDLRWNFGFSASDSAYFLPSAASTLPPGRSRRDYRQRLLAQDASFAWHHLQIWAEVFESSFDVPSVGPARTWAGYVETKYKLTPRLFGALRINRQVFSTLDTGAGRVPWGHDVWRVDLASGYRLTPHAQLKLQISAEQQETLRDQINFAAQFTLRF